MKTGPMRRMYLREATLALTLSRIAVRVVPAKRLMAWASRPPHRINRFAASEDAPWVSWAVDAIGAKQWMRANCLPRALAAQAMLRRRGVASRLCVGVAREGGKLAAHAWLELGHDIILGGTAVPRFTRLVEFGGERT